MATHSENHYFVPKPVAYPVFMSLGLLLTASGFIFSLADAKNLEYLHQPGKLMMMAGFTLIVAMIFRWMGAVIHESQIGKYKA